MDFQPVFSELRSILAPLIPHLVVKHDRADLLYLDTAHIMPNKQPMYFGAVQIKKNYVSFYLMPVYVNPSLLDDISPGLQKRMQGKSCFNFKKVEPELFAELRDLAQKGLADYRRQGYVEG